MVAGGGIGEEERQERMKVCRWGFMRWRAREEPWGSHHVEARALKWDISEGLTEGEEGPEGGGRGCWEADSGGGRGCEEADAGGGSGDDEADSGGGRGELADVVWLRIGVIGVEGVGYILRPAWRTMRCSTGFMVAVSGDDVGCGCLAMARELRDVGSVFLPRRWKPDRVAPLT